MANILLLPVNRHASLRRKSQQSRPATIIQVPGLRRSLRALTLNFIPARAGLVGHLAPQQTDLIGRLAMMT